MFLKIQNGGQGGCHIGNSCHATKNLILKYESWILHLLNLNKIISLGSKKKYIFALFSLEIHTKLNYRNVLKYWDT